MSDWLMFVLGGLSTFRLSLLVSKESGPGFVFRKLRKAPPPKSATREGLSCQFCVSVYASALVTGLLIWMGQIEWAESWLWWLAFSSAAIFCNQTFTKGQP